MGQVDEATLDTLEQQTTDMLEAQSTALACTARLWDDGIIDPRDTRKILAYVLDICREAALRPLRKNTFGVARL
jgi:geranyl-CoA carboxylase beta subunit